MHIKDLQHDIELDRTALAAICGGSCSGVPNCHDESWGQPVLPTFSGDIAQLHTDMLNYFGSVQPGFPGYGSEMSDDNEVIGDGPVRNLPGTIPPSLL